MPTPPGAHITRGDIVQVTDEADPWFGVLLVVTEAKASGRLMAFASWPQSNDEHRVGEAYRFVRADIVTPVGRVALDLA